MVLGRDDPEPPVPKRIGELSRSRVPVGSLHLPKRPEIPERPVNGSIHARVSGRREGGGGHLF